MYTDYNVGYYLTKSVVVPDDENSVDDDGRPITTIGI